MASVVVLSRAVIACTGERAGDVAEERGHAVDVQGFHAAEAVRVGVRGEAAAGQSKAYALSPGTALAYTLTGMSSLVFVGLGARTAVSNIIASHYVAQAYRVGQTVRVAGVEGRIVETTPTAVFVAGPEGRVMIPAKTFAENASTLVTES